MTEDVTRADESGLTDFNTAGVRSNWSEVTEFTRPDASSTDFTYFRRKFSFVLKNPASQENAAPSITLSANFEKADWSKEWGIRESGDSYTGGLTTGAYAQTSDVNTFRDTYSGKPVYDFANTTTTSWYGSSAETLTEYKAANKADRYMRYPLYTMPLRFQAFMAQSSPFPCDTNTLTLFVQTNVPLLKACAPKLTLSGLTGTDTASNGATDFVVTLGVSPKITYTDSTTVWKGDKAGTKTGTDEGVQYVKTGSTGTLTLDMSTWLLDADLQTLDVKADGTDVAASLNTVDQLYMNFDLRNINQEHSCASPTIIMSLDPADTCTGVQNTRTDTTGDPSQLILAATTNGVYYGLGTAAAGVTNWPTLINSANGGFSTAVYAETDLPAGVNSKWAGAQAGEGRPMCIRKPEFKCIPAHQSTHFPCDANTVTVTLQSFVPIFAACNEVTQSTIDITGFDIFQADTLTALTAAVNLADDSAVDPTATAAWTADAKISVTLATGATMKADQQYLVKFTPTTSRTALARRAPTLACMRFNLYTPCRTPSQLRRSRAAFRPRPRPTRTRAMSSTHSRTTLFPLRGTEMRGVPGTTRPTHAMTTSTL